MSEAERTLAAEFVLGTLDPKEREMARTRLGADPHFAGLVRQWERRLSPLHELAVPVAPPASLWRVVALDLREASAAGQTGAMHTRPVLAVASSAGPGTEGGWSAPRPQPPPQSQPRQAERAGEGPRLGPLGRIGSLLARPFRAGRDVSAEQGGERRRPGTQAPRPSASRPSASRPPAPEPRAPELRALDIRISGARTLGAAIDEAVAAGFLPSDSRVPVPLANPAPPNLAPPTPSPPIPAVSDRLSPASAPPASALPRPRPPAEPLTPPPAFMFLEPDLPAQVEAPPSTPAPTPAPTPSAGDEGGKEGGKEGEEPEAPIAAGPMPEGSPEGVAGEGAEPKPEGDVTEPSAVADAPLAEPAPPLPEAPAPESGADTSVAEAAAQAAAESAGGSAATLPPDPPEVAAGGPGEEPVPVAAVPSSVLAPVLAPALAPALAPVAETPPEDTASSSGAAAPLAAEADAGISSLGVPSLGVPSLGVPPLGVPPLGVPPLGVPSLGVPSLGVPSLGVPLLGIPSLGAPPLAAPASASATPSPPPGSAEETEMDHQSLPRWAEAVASGAVSALPDPAAARPAQAITPPDTVVGRRMARWRAAVGLLLAISLGLAAFVVYREWFWPRAGQWVAVLQPESLPSVAVRVDPASGALFVRAFAPAPPEGETYRLWLITRKQGTHLLGAFSAGLVARSPDLAQLGRAALSTSEIVVTREPVERALPPGAGPGDGVVYRGRLAPE